MKLKGDSPYVQHLINTEFESSTNPTGMIGFSFGLPRKLDRMSIRLDLSYLAFENDLFDMAYINGNFLFAYQYTDRDVDFTGLIGLSMGYAIKDEHQYDYMSNDTQQGLVIGFGMGYKFFFVEYRYLYSNGMITATDIISRVGSSHLNFGLRFNIRIP